MRDTNNTDASETSERDGQHKQVAEAGLLKNQGECRRQEVSADAPGAAAPTTTERDSGRGEQSEAQPYSGSPFVQAMRRRAKLEVGRREVEEIAGDLAHLDVDANAAARQQAELDRAYGRLDLLLVESGWPTTRYENHHPPVAGQVPLPQHQVLRLRLGVEFDPEDPQAPQDLMTGPIEIAIRTQWMTEPRGDRPPLEVVIREGVGKEEALALLKEVRWALRNHYHRLLPPREEELETVKRPRRSADVCSEGR